MAQAAIPSRTAPRLAARAHLARVLRPWVWLGASLVLIAGAVFYPVIVLIGSAFTRYNSIGYATGFAGLDNFFAVGASPELPGILWNTARWVVVVVGVTLAVSLPLVQFLHALFRGRRFARVALLFPWAASLVMTSLVWRYIYDNYYGYLNRILLDLGWLSEPVAWTVDPALTPWSLAFLGVVVSVPFTTYVLLAGRQSIPEEVYEAASMDGGGPIQTFFRVTLPLLRPSITTAVILNAIYVFNSFPIIWVLTGGQPGHHADTLVTYMYKVAFKTDLDIGKASALALFNVLVTLLLSLYPLRSARRRGENARADEQAPRRRLWARRSADRPMLVLDIPVPRNSARIRAVAYPLIGVLTGLFFLSPYIVMLLSSLKNDRDLFATPARYLPTEWVWSNWVTTFQNPDLLLFFRNSLIVATAGAALVLLAAIPAAYFTARFRFRGRTAFLYAVLVTQMFAPVALVIGIYRQWQGLGLSDSLIALVVIDAAFNLAFAVWLLNGFFQSIPEEIEDAAKIDGLGDLAILRRVVLPLALPGLVTAAIFTFIAIWNEFVVALTITTTPATQPLTVGINSFIGQYQIHYQSLFAASLVAIVPVVVLFVAIERHLVGGLTAGAVK
ncbi:ABC transporter permease subunit [Nonomuraea lactucae]|uniref:ABC transporter permease n=1 Tax=Nonomuraea lactucae TaxID=2249762 RepID=UPI000DE2EDD3|nr:ABC transporter permease subunit [Nonomuraea lactucae]